jgi:hypothetical protein
VGLDGVPLAVVTGLARRSDFDILKLFSICQSSWYELMTKSAVTGSPSCVCRKSHPPR